MERHPDAAVRVHRAGHGLDPRGADPPRLLPRVACRAPSGADGSQEAQFGAGVVEQLSLSPSEYWQRQCHLGSSFIRRHEVALARRRSASIGSCGQRLSRTSKVAGRSRAHTCAWRSPVSRRTRCAGWSVGNAADVYGFDSAARSSGSPDEHGPTPAEVDRPARRRRTSPTRRLRCPALAARAVRRGDRRAPLPGRVRPARGRVRRLALRPVPPASSRGPGRITPSCCTAGSSPGTPMSTCRCRDPTSLVARSTTPTRTPLTVAEIERRDESLRAGRTLVLLDDPDHGRLAQAQSPSRSGSREIEQLPAAHPGSSGCRRRMTPGRRARQWRAGRARPDRATSPTRCRCEIFCADARHPRRRTIPVFRLLGHWHRLRLDPVMDPRASASGCVAEMADMYVTSRSSVDGEAGAGRRATSSPGLDPRRGGRPSTPHARESCSRSSSRSTWRGPRADRRTRTATACGLSELPDQWAKLSGRDRSLLRQRGDRACCATTARTSSCGASPLRDATLRHADRGR